MANSLGELRSILMDVVFEGTVTVKKQKLLWLLGKNQDRPTAWGALLDEWEELGQARAELYGAEVYDKIILTMPLAANCVHVGVNTWAQES